MGFGYGLQIKAAYNSVPVGLCIVGINMGTTIRRYRFTIIYHYRDNMLAWSQKVGNIKNLRGLQKQGATRRYTIYPNIRRFGPLKIKTDMLILKVFGDAYLFTVPGYTLVVVHPVKMGGRCIDIKKPFLIGISRTRQHNRVIQRCEIPLLLNPDTSRIQRKSPFPSQINNRAILFVFLSAR